MEGGLPPVGECAKDPPPEGGGVAPAKTGATEGVVAADSVRSSPSGLTAASPFRGRIYGDPARSIPSASPTNSNSFNTLKKTRTAPSDASRSTPILIPPDSTGRAHVRRPLRLSGVVEREASHRPSPGASSARFARRGLSLQGRRAFRIGVWDQFSRRRYGGNATGPGSNRLDGPEDANPLPAGGLIGSGLKPRAPKAHRKTDYAERSSSSKR